MKKVVLSLFCISIFILGCCVFSACDIGKKKLEFYVNGELYETIKTSGNEKIDMPDIPTSAEQIFDGWYFEGTTVEFTSETYVATELTANKKIVAKMVDLFMFDDEEQEIQQLTERAKELVVDLVIPAEINGVSVKKIGDSAFYWNEQLQSVSLSDTIEVIGQFAFYECENIKSIKIPASVKEIKANAFTHLWKATELSFEDNSQLEVIGAHAFSRCANLTCVEIPASVDIIGDGAFYECFELSSVTFEENSCLLNIGEFAFWSNKFTSISLPNSLQTIGYAAFYSCQSLETIILPSSLTTLGSFIFSNTELGMISVFCESVEQPIGWADNWHCISSGYTDKYVIVYWGGTWSLLDGVPTPNQNS